MYEHESIEQEIQEQWKKENVYTFSPESSKPKKYILIELPYPSGALHTGHWYAFSMPDMFVRYRRMVGDNVMFPLGFDSFGLPAENAAIKRNIDPARWTEKNIEEMRNGFTQMGLSIDPAQSIATSDPSFYRWTQWIFTAFFKKGLAYKKEAPTNWCDSCKTVIANEQVVRNDEDEEVCERCNTLIQKKNLSQWFFKITDYANRLVNDLDDVDWPDAIKHQQRNWIGRSKGVYISFPCTNGEYRAFTTRADTLYGVSFCAISPEHVDIAILVEHASNKKEIEAYIENAQKMEQYARADDSREKTGIEVHGVTLTHPATGNSIPLYVADYVLADVGTGFLMGVPAHDERDFAFAKKYSIAIIPVVKEEEGGGVMPYSGEGVLHSSGGFDGLDSRDAREKIGEKYGEHTVVYKLRDWSISRQRYWGCPIPVVYDPEGVAHCVPEKHLPWTLPTDVDHTPTGNPPLARSKELFERTERLFGKGWVPEVETFDTFVDSSWYFIRYLDPTNEKTFCSKTYTKEWLPVDRYYGGAEHTTLHLLYSRFFYKAMCDLGMVETGEPYVWRLNRGLILAPDGKKISKSLGNDIDISKFLKRYGADAMRMSFAFLGPFDGPHNYPYNPTSLVGIRKFLERVYGLAHTLKETSDPRAEQCVAEAIENVISSFERHKFNTAISFLMECVREVRQVQIAQKEYETILLLLAPLAPFLTDHIWRLLGHATSIHIESYPLVREISKKNVSIVVQISGKKKGMIDVSSDATQEEIVAIARKEVSAVATIQEKNIVYVAGRVLNFVV